MTALVEFNEAFELAGKTNGGRHWSARNLAEMLGYENFSTFNKAINKAIGVCTTLGISVSENFKQIDEIVDGVSEHDFELTRFACYLTAMNADIGKSQVAKAQAYFAALADAVQEYIQNAENVERVQIRDDVSDRERSLSGVAKQAGLIPQKYGLFHNAGYRGMYNMDYAKLRARKGVDPSRSVLDFMGKQELAAQLFRLTETEAKIKNERVKGQQALENAAHQVGRKVRQTMIETSGTYPENLPIAKDIKHVRSALKQTNRQMVKLDRKRITQKD
jgi:DNA-damage-inducible protein D